LQGNAVPLPRILQIRLLARSQSAGMINGLAVLHGRRSNAS
jgi:hypothetical protein